MCWCHCIRPWGWPPAGSGGVLSLPHLGGSGPPFVAKTQFRGCQRVALLSAQVSPRGTNKQNIFPVSSCVSAQDSVSAFRPARGQPAHLCVAVLLAQPAHSSSSAFCSAHFSCGRDSVPPTAAPSSSLESHLCPPPVLAQAARSGGRRPETLCGRGSPSASSHCKLNGFHREELCLWSRQKVS